MVVPPPGCPTRRARSRPRPCIITLPFLVHTSTPATATPKVTQTYTTPPSAIRQKQPPSAPRAAQHNAGEGQTPQHVFHPDRRPPSPIPSPSPFLRLFSVCLSVQFSSFSALSPALAIGSTTPPRPSSTDSGTTSPFPNLCLFPSPLRPGPALHLLRSASRGNEAGNTSGHPAVPGTAV
ncbi:hypothetical protein CALVIDRAFT_370088 [Calocera viscosa TUFC12733]|uniref:Uncharacterized protein n=1 Tax=Calocera viscosa (strain TUFC12733) TaxID=1330018 RepID=A0A167GXK0_CALVF|nr:hypothetical protein CALVIDRAFT_370088 [Calocera viscosa TUFC12733]